MKVLVINCGSSSIKYQFIDMDNQSVLAKGLVERIATDGRVKQTNIQGKVYENDIEIPNHSVGVAKIIELLLDNEYGVVSSLDEINVVAHRVVHGGEYFDKSIIITPENLEKIRDCIPLAPLHNPSGVMGIEAIFEAMPNAMQTATFDTAFHQTMPKYAYTYALQKEVAQKFKIRKYGMHGTSHRYVTLEASKLLNKDVNEVNLITCHLGAGSSITAVKNGKSVDTTMGFTPLAGLIMGTRCGDIDPAVVTFLVNHGYSADEVDNIMNKKSGLFGVSGVSLDCRDIKEEATKGNEDCQLALDMFEYQIVKFIGSYIPIVNPDAIIFTAGIGENNADIKDRVMAHFPNIEGLVIPTNEELMIALDAVKLVK